MSSTTPAPPPWFQTGTIIDITDDTWDAAEFLEGAEFDHDWRLCMVPLAVYGVESFAPVATSTETVEQRVGAIQRWASDQGGLAKALHESPPVALWTSQGLSDLDGYHRRGLATAEGLSEIPMLVGLGEREDA